MSASFPARQSLLKFLGLAVRSHRAVLCCGVYVQGSRAADGRFRISRKLDRRLRHEVPRLRGVASAAAEEANRAALNRGGSRFVAGVEANWAHFRALWGMDTFQMLRGSSTDPELRTLPVPYFEDPDKEAEFKAYTLSILPLRLVLGSVLCMLTEFSEIILAEVYDCGSSSTGTASSV